MDAEGRWSTTSVEIPTVLTVDATDLEEGMARATDQIQQFQSAADSTAASSTLGFTRIGSSLSHLGVSAFVVYDRINIASEAVTNAETRQQLAQERLTQAVQRYGAGSQQAIRAQQELEISTRGVDIAHERYNIRILFAVGSVLPSFVVGIEKAVAALGKMDIANKLTALSTIELTDAQLALLAATGVGLVAAVGIAAAIASGAFNVGGGASAGGGATSVNVYGDVNVQGGGGTADFGRNVAQSTRG